MCVCNMCIYLYFSYTYEIITMLPISKDIHSSKSLLSQSQLQGHMEKGTIFPHQKDWLEFCRGKKKGETTTPKTKMEPENDGF